jgi:hypothetical protein
MMGGFSRGRPFFLLSVSSDIETKNLIFLLVMVKFKKVVMGGYYKYISILSCLLGGSFPEGSPKLFFKVLDDNGDNNCAWKGDLWHLYDVFDRKTFF